MTRAAFEKWLESYVRPWEARTPEPLRDIWASDAIYWWGPFNEPRRGREAIYQHHVGAIKNQDEIRWDYQILATGNDRGVARFWLKLKNIPTGVRREYDGIFLVSLDAENRCCHFEEWYHHRDLA